ncbi:replication-relaxation family protein [Streptomyces decoyicus]|uniref:replication-relaxation family protein n=1 Tax=Streptomyces decoyicus TaxID=249567 RepID=UPI003812D6FA
MVLAALGVVKVATAEQIRQLMCPGTASAQTVRNGCLDLGRDGLVESLGSASRTNAAGNLVSEKLWNLSGPGLEAAAAVLDRPVREMGGTARGAARSGAKHALKVTDTLVAFLQTPPEPTRPVPRSSLSPPPRPSPAPRRAMTQLLSLRPPRNARTGWDRSAPGRRRWCSRSRARSPPRARTAPAPMRSSLPRRPGCR